MQAEDRYTSRVDLFVAPDLINPVTMGSNFLRNMGLLTTYSNLQPPLMCKSPFNAEQVCVSMIKLRQIYLAGRGTSLDEYDIQHVDHTPVKIPPFRLKLPRWPHYVSMFRNSSS
jgi:hypothetical protein